MSDESGTPTEQAPADQAAASQSKITAPAGDPGSSITAQPPAQPTGTFKDQLPAELKDLATLKDIKTVADLAKSYDHAQRMVGKSRLEMPAENDSPEAWNDFYKSIGRPDSANDYKLWDGPEPKLPEGVTRDEEMEKFFKDRMHKRGLNNAMASGLYQDFMEFAGLKGARNAELTAQNMAAWDKESREQFGLAYNEKIGSAQRVIQTINNPEFNKLLDKTGLSNHPVSLAVFAKLGEMMGEHVTSGGGGRGGSALTPEAARSQIANLQRDKSFMKSYMDAQDQGHTDAVNQMKNLHNFAYPDLGE